MQSFFLGVSSHTMLRDGLKPGTDVEHDGVYWVYHYQHRQSHLATLQKGEQFPYCQRCGMRVRFERAIEHRSALHISADADFSLVRR